jgi:hypothetical protein
MKRLHSPTLVVVIRALQAEVDRVKREQKQAMALNDEDRIADCDMRLYHISTAASIFRDAYLECQSVEGNLPSYEEVKEERN